MKVLSHFPVLFTALVFYFSGAQAAQDEGKKIAWLTDYEKAVQLSRAASKPIVLFFTGSDWCGWCNKLEKEALDTEEFANSAADSLIFVKINFPMKSKLDSKTAQQNETLQKKFGVRSFPSVIVVDPEQQALGVTGYRAGGGKQYAQHLHKMVSEYTAYKKQMQRLGHHQFSGKDLKRLYQKAHELGLENDTNLLTREGINSDQAHFFLAERYRHLVKGGQMQSTEAVSLKEKLLGIDPDNLQLTHYQVAIIDFEGLSEQLEMGSLTPEMTVTPLVDYIVKHSKKDKENIWRLNMVISQVYLEKNKYAEALKYAQDSHAAAPTSIQPEISMAINNIKERIEKIAEK